MTNKPKCGECEQCGCELDVKDGKYTGFESFWCLKDDGNPKFIVTQSCSKPYPKTSPKWCPLRGGKEHA